MRENYYNIEAERSTRSLSEDRKCLMRTELSVLHQRRHLLDSWQRHHRARSVRDDVFAKRAEERLLQLRMT